MEMNYHQGRTSTGLYLPAPIWATQKKKEQAT